MGILVCGGALLQCSFGQLPGTLLVLPTAKVMNMMPIASIMDNKPFVNIMPFGMCNSLANPAVAAATAAAMGVLTPMPCIPTIVSPWTPGSATVLVGNNPALNNSSQLMCAFGGCINIKMPGQTQIMVP